MLTRCQLTWRSLKHRADLSCRGSLSFISRGFCVKCSFTTRNLQSCEFPSVSSSCLHTSLRARTGQCELDVVSHKPRVTSREHWWRVSCVCVTLQSSSNSPSVPFRCSCVFSDSHIQMSCWLLKVLRIVQKQLVVLNAPPSIVHSVLLKTIMRYRHLSHAHHNPYVTRWDVLERSFMCKWWKMSSVTVKTWNLVLVLSVRTKMFLLFCVSCNKSVSPANLMRSWTKPECEVFQKTATHVLL